MNDHLDTYAAESAALEPTTLEGWLDRVEAVLGHSADGDLDVDGYSLDTFAQMFEAGLSAEVAATRIRRAVFVSPDGTVYRLGRAQRSDLSPVTFAPVYAETYSVLTLDGSQTVAYTLPDDARLMWSPDRDVR